MKKTDFKVGMFHSGEIQAGSEQVLAYAEGLYIEARSLNKESDYIESRILHNKVLGMRSASAMLFGMDSVLYVELSDLIEGYLEEKGGS